MSAPGTWLFVAPHKFRVANGGFPDIGRTATLGLAHRGRIGIADTAIKYRLPPEESRSRLAVPSKRAATAPASERADYKGPTVLPLRLAGPWSPWAVQPAPHWPSPDPAP